MNTLITNRLGWDGKQLSNFASSLNVGSVDVQVKWIACYLMYICEPSTKSHFVSLIKMEEVNVRVSDPEYKCVHQCDAICWVLNLTSSNGKISAPSGLQWFLWPVWFEVQPSLHSPPSCTSGKHGRACKACPEACLRDPAHYCVRNAASSLLKWAPAQMFWKLWISCSICRLKSSKCFMNSE